MTLDEQIDLYVSDIITSTRELVRIPSVQGAPLDMAPFGTDVNNALEYMLNLSQDLGFNAVNLDGYAGYAEYGTGEEYIAVLGHLDVVPQGDGWDYPPFGAEIHEGKIYGRGTVDDKSPLISSLYGLKAIKELGIPLKRKVRIIFGTNEETGCKDMPRYNSTEKPPVFGFTPDGHYPVVFAEKGITVFDVVKNISMDESLIKRIKGGHYANMVPSCAEAEIESDNIKDLYEKCISFSQKEGLKLVPELRDGKLIIISHGVSAHGSTPELGKNAVMQLFKFIDENVQGSDEVSRLIHFFNQNVGFDTEGRKLGINLYDEVSGNLSFNIGAVDISENNFVMKLNVRYPIKSKLEHWMEPLAEKLKPAGLRIENLWHKHPLYFPKEHPLINTLQRVYKEETGLTPELLSIGMGTYAKEIPNIVAFGPILPGRLDLDHKANENIEIDDLILNTKIYAKAIMELANLES